MKTKEIQLLTLFKSPKGGNYCLSYIEPLLTSNGELDIQPRYNKDKKFIAIGFDVQQVWLDKEFRLEEALSPEMFDGRLTTIQYDYVPTYGNTAKLVIVDFLDKDGRSLLLSTN